jgi:hypothetical protein
VVELWITEPISGIQLYARILQPDPALYPGEQFPAVVLVPGGTGDGAPAINSSQFSRLAAQGFIVAGFNAPGRGNGQPGNLRSDGSEDCNGFAGQNALKAVIEYMAALPNVDPNLIGVNTSSYGITMGAGTLGRYPDLPVRYLVDMEGPSNNLITTFYYSGHERTMCDHWSVISDTSQANIDWWMEREAYRYIGAFQGDYLRIQAVTDHAQPPGIYTHTLEMNNAAVNGGVPWVRVNSLEMGNPISTVYTASLPLWLPGRLADYSDLNANYIAEMAQRFGANVIPDWRVSLELPLAVERLADGSTLITDGSAQHGSAQQSKFITVDNQGRVTSIYLGSLSSVGQARRLPNEHTLLADSANDRVIEIDVEHQIVWNSAEVNLSDGSHLAYPINAAWLPDDHLLITDQGNQRVLEIDRAGTVLWQFGETGVPGGDETHLDSPGSAERLDNGNTLVADTSNQRILEVTPTGEVAWIYAPAARRHYSCYTAASRLANGNTLIAYTRNARIIEITPAGYLAWFYAAGLQQPGDATRLASGNTRIADSGHGRVIEGDTSGRSVWAYPPWAVEGGFVLVTEMAADSVAKIDVTTDQIIGRVTVGPSPGGLVADLSRRWAYVAVQQDDQIVALQADSLTAASLTIPGLGRVPIGLDLTSDGETLLVTTRGTDGVISADDRLDIVALDTSVWPPVATLVTSIPTGLPPTNVAVNHDDQYAVVTVRNQPAILIIDLQTYTIVAQAPGLPLNAEPEGLDIHPSQNIAYATLHGPISAVEVINLDTLTFVARGPDHQFSTCTAKHRSSRQMACVSIFPGKRSTKCSVRHGRPARSRTRYERHLAGRPPAPFHRLSARRPRYVANTNNTHPTGSISIIENYSGDPSISGPILTDLVAIRLAYFPPPCYPVEGVEVSGPETLLTGENGAFTVTYVPITATAPVTITWDNGADGITATYSWDEPGVYTLTATAASPCGGQTSGTFTVTVCQPVEAVAVDGLRELNAGESQLYTASYTPISATLPVTIAWDNGSIGPTAAYRWTLPGIYTITAIAVNPCGGPVTGTFTVTVSQPVEAVEIDGPSNLNVGKSQLYTASYAPITATLPVTITWDNGSTGPTAAYSWTTSGVYTITATAVNPCGGPVTGTFTVTVCQPLETATVNGPLSLTVGESGIFTATYTPSPPRCQLPLRG